MKKRLIFVVVLALVCVLALSAFTAPATEPTRSGSGADGKWKIALSNSFVGNDWRQEMQKIAQYVADSDVWKDRVDFTIVNCENTPEDQSASIDALIMEGYDAILIDASSPTALNNACQRALDAGIVVISFDQIVNMPGVVAYGCPFGDTAEESAKYLVEAMGGKGNLVVDRGLAGASGSIPLYDRAMEVFNQYPDIKVVHEYDSNFAEGDTLTGMQAAIAANPVIDGVYTQAYAAPVVQALKEADRPMVPIVAWSYNSSFEALEENGCDGAIIHNGPGIGADAMAMAVNVLEGTEEYPTGEQMDSPWMLYVMDTATAEAAGVTAPFEQIEEGVNWWPELAPGMQNPTLSDFVGVTVPIEAIL